MIKICIMGNSHVGSVKRGWDNIYKDYPEIEITFFAHRAAGLDGLIAHDGKLIPNNEALAKALEFTSGGKKEIDPGEYDIFVIYGAGTNINFVKNDQFYSRAVIKSSLDDFVANTLAFNILKRLRTLTNKTVFIGHTPLITATQILSDNNPDDYMARVALINDIVYHPLNSELVRQPLSTIVNGNNTHPEFSKGSRRLAIGDSFDDEYHPESDIDHMNDKFGEIWLREFLKNYVEKMIDAN